MEIKEITKKTYEWNGVEYQNKEQAQRQKDFHDSFNPLRDDAIAIKSDINKFMVRLVEEGFCDNEFYLIKNLNEASRSLKNIIGEYNG